MTLHYYRWMAWAARGCVVALTLLGWCRTGVAAGPVRMEIDAGRPTPISPYIYGTNQPDWQQQKGLYTLTRWGGNRITAYNWENNASNAGSDWHHQNDANLSSSDTPGEPVRRLVADSHAAGAAAVISIPILGYVSADKAGDGDVRNTPDYLHKRFHPSLAKKGEAFTQPPDVKDETVYQDEFVDWLERAFPESRQDPARTIFYDLDNEPDLWAETHARIHPQKVRYDEIVRLNVEYAAAIKDAAPKALVFGPVNYGWGGFTTLQGAPDAAGRDFLDFYLQQMHAAQEKGGRRLLDALDLHWYPEAQGGGVRIVEDDARPEVAAARIQAPRSLWDPNYVEDSWITKHSTHGPIRLLPRVREKIEKDYPGTRLAITEYYFGGGGDISGALAEADVLGIFGREGVFAAALWHVGKTDDRFIHAAVAMFRNYDGQGGKFGDTSLAATNSDIERSSVYASRDEQGRVMIVALNKSGESLPVEITLKNIPSRARAAVYQLTKAEPQPVRVADVAADSAGWLRFGLPAESVSTLVLDAAERAK